MKRYVLIVSGVLIFAGLFLLVRNTPLAQLFNPQELQTIILGYGVFGPLIYIGVYIVACLVFFPATPITLAGGALFGPVLGTVYTVVGATLGACGAFLFARIFGRSIRSSDEGVLGKKLAHYNDAIKKNGFMTVLFLRFVPLFPFNGLNFALGLTSVRTRDYVLGTFLGIIPGTSAFVFFGNSLAELNPIKIAVAVLAMVALSLLGKLILAKSSKK